MARRTNTGFETGKQLLHCLTKLFATPTDTTLLKLAKTLAGSVLERDVSNDSEASQVSYVENQEMPARSEPDVEDLSQRMSQSSISPNRRPKRTGSQFSSPISSSTLRPGSSQSPFVSGNQQKRQKASNEDSEGSATPVDWNVEEIIWEAESEALVSHSMLKNLGRSEFPGVHLFSSVSFLFAG